MDQNSALNSKLVSPSQVPHIRPWGVSKALTSHIPRTRPQRELPSQGQTTQPRGAEGISPWTAPSAEPLLSQSVSKVGSSYLQTSPGSAHCLHQPAEPASGSRRPLAALDMEAGSPTHSAPKPKPTVTFLRNPVQRPRPGMRTEALTWPSRRASPHCWSLRPMSLSLSPGC